MQYIKSLLNLVSSPLGISLLAFISCGIYYYLDSKKTKLRTYAEFILLGLLAFAVYKFAGTVWYRLNSFVVWDFTSWYLWGKVAAEGYNFYLPEYSQQIFDSLNLPDKDFTDFKEAIVNVGFLYPPPTMLYFIPLGYLSLNTALIVWTLFTLLFLAGCIFLVYDSYFKTTGYHGLALITILFFLYPSVRFTMVCSQTNYIILFLILLMRKYADTKYSGIILAFALFTKPFMLIFGLYFVISKNWKAIAYFISSSAVISVISIIAFGTETFFSYFFNNATQRLPDWVYSEDINQSLNAVLLRSNLISTENPALYVVLISGIILLSIWACFRLLKKEQRDGIWAILLLVGLLIYPGTLSYYGVALLFVLFQLFDSKNQLAISFYFITPIVGLLFYLDSFSLFSSICLFLIITTIILWRNLNTVKASENAVFRQ